MGIAGKMALNFKFFGSGFCSIEDWQVSGVAVLCMKNCRKTENR
jgi:hypothetical protein